MSEIRYDGRVAIVTGAGGGLGREHALLLASRGAKVVVNDLGGSFTGEGASHSPAEQVVEEIKAAGGEAVSNFDSVTDGEKIVQGALDAFGQIDIIINNAGILRDVSFHKMTDEDWNKIFEVHVFGSYSVTHAAWPHLRDNQYGRVVMTTSAAGLYGNFGQANYSAAKLALMGLGQTLALEGEKRNIKCNVIAPIAGSRMTETVLPPDIVEKLKPQYVSPLVAYLCSEECPTNGGTYEVGVGHIHRVRMAAGEGTTVPADDLTPESVRDNWDKINDMTGAAYPDNLTDSTMKFMGAMQG